MADDSWWKDDETEFIQFSEPNVVELSDCALPELNGKKLVEPSKQVFHCGKMYEWTGSKMTNRSGPNEGKTLYFVRDPETGEFLFVPDWCEQRYSQVFVNFEDRNNPIVVSW